MWDRDYTELAVERVFVYVASRNAERRARLAQLTLLIVARRIGVESMRDAPSAADFEIGREKTARNALFGHSNFHPSPHLTLILCFIFKRAK